MTTVLEIKGDDDEGRRHLRAIETAVLAGVASGKLSMKIDGVSVVIQSATHGQGQSQFHPTDKSQDRHTQHPGGPRQDVPVSVTFVPKP